MGTSIEKVSGLEALAEAGLAVPQKRLYLSADELREATPETLKGFLEGLPLRTHRPSLLVRSAHPQEDRFSSGAFTSPALELSQEDLKAPVAVWAKIQELHRKMIAAAEPQDSLQIRRALRHKAIEGYQAGDMGVLLNEAIPTTKHLTVVTAKESTRVQFQPGDLPMEYDFAAPEGYVRQKLEDHPFQNGKFTADQLKEEIEKANAVFSTNMEYEVLVDESGQTWFVQVRTPNAPEPQDLSRLTEWSTGIQAYQRREPLGGSVYKTPLLVARAATDPEVRSTLLLIIDEAKWAYEGINAVGDNYARLLGMAEEIETYSLWVKNVRVSSAKRRHPLQVPRDQLVECASVQIRGWSDRDSGVDSASPHVPFGTNGPRQVGIHYEHGNLDHELTGRKDGDAITFLLRRDPALWKNEKVSRNQVSIL